ncbi:hypothetical protein bthur0011_8620 [Bacillus thuringiensis serovar huazhongensis BGSC 4BD1]|nr:hypothetical protein bthur0011_8620 [Bacillus thuringiensis serovar huazhongensis BGSC 4BD1]KLA27447.1 hypothetical protein B4080_1114 [Bacillus cereus]
MFPLGLIGLIIAFLVGVIIWLSKNKREQKFFVYLFDKIGFF